MRMFSAILPLFLVACVASGNIVLPLDHALIRETPLHFGVYVTPDPDQNPIDPPERFTGFHAAVDYEVSADELDADVSVYAICQGKVLYAGFAEGYGGMVAHRCRIHDEDVVVLYGHLARAALPKIGSTVYPGTKIAVLAPARSTDSDGNRKHLHLGIHKGRELDVRGYVRQESELSDFLNPLEVLPTFGIEEALPSMRPYWKTGSGSQNAEG